MKNPTSEFMNDWPMPLSFKNLLTLRDLKELFSKKSGESNALESYGITPNQSGKKLLDFS